jgi:cysteine desulfurase
MTPIYLDHNSTTPTLPEVLEAMQPYWSERFGNPASAHAAGRKSRQALETAREQLAQLLDALPEEVVFTSGATEANNLAIFGCAGPRPFPIISSGIEHPSVTEPIAELGRRGFDVRLLPVDQHGVVRPAALSGLRTADTGLIAVMLVNNETGAIQPVAELVEQTRDGSGGPLFHCDAVQAVGKQPVRFHELGVTTLSLSAHKFGGPRGVGALLVRKGTRLKPLFFGGHQQQSLRPGTESTTLAVGLAKALELATTQMQERWRHVSALREFLLERLTRDAAPLVVNGSPAGSPYTLNISFPGCRAESLLMKLDLAEVACSTGSACSSGSLLPSPVLKAMGCPEPVLHSAVRLSFNHSLRIDELESAAIRIIRVVEELRQHAD